MAMLSCVIQGKIKASLHTVEAGACCMTTSPMRRRSLMRLRRPGGGGGGQQKKSRTPHQHCTLPSSSKQAHEGARSNNMKAKKEPELTCKKQGHSSSNILASMPSSEELSALRMPVLRCSFPSLLHPQYETIREQCEAWILAVAQPPSAASRRFLQDCLLPRLFCRILPHASVSVHRLVHAAKMISWLFIADDDDDHPDALGSDYDATAHRADTVLAILRHGCSSPPAVDPASAYSSFNGRSRAGMEAFAQLWNEISKEMSPSLRTRFISAMADYFDGVKVQVAFRKANCLPNVKHYMEIRRQSSFTLPAFVLAEYVLGVELDEAVYNNSLIVELHNTVRDFMNLCNDIISCPIEIGVGDYFNLPSILYASNDASFPCSSFQEALDLSAHMVHDLNDHYLSLLPSVHSSLLMASPSLCTYVGFLSSGMSGSLAWSLETARYRNPSTRSELYQLGCTHGPTHELK